MNLGSIPPALLFGLFLWSIFWKGLALWHASKCDQKNWFVVMLVLNTVGLAEIAYLFFFTKKKWNPKILMFWTK